MNRSVFLVATTLILATCEPYEQMKVGGIVTKNGSTIETVEYNATALVEYASSNYLSKDSTKGSGSNLWDCTQIGYDPPGGCVKVKMLGRGIRCTADPQYWEFVVRSLEGRDILRVKGKGQIAGYYKSGRGQTWWSTQDVPINQEIKAPFLFYAVDNFHHKTSGFRIYPNVAQVPSRGQR